MDCSGVGGERGKGEGSCATWKGLPGVALLGWGITVKKKGDVWQRGKRGSHLTSRQLLVVGSQGV